jgi:hypothetical protein
VDVPSGGVRRVVVICLTLMTSKPRLTNPSEISSAGVFLAKDSLFFSGYVFMAENPPFIA